MAIQKTDFVEICIIVFAIFSLFVVKLWQLKISKRKLDFSTFKFLIQLFWFYIASQKKKKKANPPPSSTLTISLVFSSFESIVKIFRFKTNTYYKSFCLNKTLRIQVTNFETFSQNQHKNKNTFGMRDLATKTQEIWGFLRLD